MVLRLWTGGECLLKHAQGPGFQLENLLQKESTSNLPKTFILEMAQHFMSVDRISFNVLFGNVV